jgi:hypothetical protein
MSVPSVTDALFGEGTEEENEFVQGLGQFGNAGWEGSVSGADLARFFWKNAPEFFRLQDGTNRIETTHDAAADVDGILNAFAKYGGARGQRVKSLFEGEKMMVFGDSIQNAEKKALLFTAPWLHLTSRQFAEGQRYLREDGDSK